MVDDTDDDGLSELVLLAAGSNFGNYIVHECIGQGAMGNVYRAQHALLEKPVALKVMDTSLHASADARARFLREGQAAAAIKHPNVVDITDVGVFEGTPYLVMELLEGEDLQIYLQRRKSLSEREVASLLIPITAALGAAHDRGVVHRDLKPSNIFLSRGPDGEVVPKILDFGISKVAHAVTNKDFESTPFNQLIGSPLYLPPEAVRGSRDFTTKSDQYSLGVVLYECVTGRAPFAGDSLMALLNAISAGDFLRPSRVRPDISGAMERVILRAMNPEPALRFEHIRDLGRELLDVAGMRTQMLWGRTFGRIDLSEPPPGPRNSSTSPVALLPSQSERPGPAPADTGGKLRYGRHILLGVATLAAIFIPNFWAMRSPTPQASSVPPSEAYAAREPRAAARPLTPLIASPAPQKPDPALEPAPVLERDPQSTAPLEWSSAPRRNEITPAPGLDAADPSRSLASERPRATRRARATAPGAELRQPRASLLPEPRSRAGLVRDPDDQRENDDLRQLFLVPGNSREGAPKPVPPGGLGANESPILD